MYWDAPGEGNFWSDYLGWDADRDGRGDRRYYSSNRMDALVYRYPQLKLLAASPLVQAMQALEARFPILRPAGVIDRFPAMRPYGGAAPAAPLPGVQGEGSPCAVPAGAEPRNRS